jgi:lysophospholipase L1-like esterase
MATPDSPAGASLFARVALFLLTGLVTGEVALRVLDLVQGRSPFAGLVDENDSTSLRYQPHPFMGFTLKPGNKDEGINRLGLRGPAMKRQKPAGVFRILCLGGSTTYGSNVVADRSYPAVLQQLLEGAEHDTPPLRYEVLNCGVPGYTTAESLVNLALRLVEYDADALVIYHAINDARLIQVGGFLPDYSHMRTSWKYPAISPLEWALLSHCRVFFHLLHESYVDPSKLRLEQLVFVDAARGAHPAPNWEGVNPKGIETYLRNLRNLVAVAREHGIAPVLTTFAASSEHLVGPGYDDVLKLMNAQVRRLATQKGLPLIDLAGPLSRRPALFDDYVHLNVDGCRAQARQVFEQARAQGLWHLR